MENISISIKNMDSELWWAVKAAATADRQTVSEWVQKTLKAAIESRGN